MPRLSNIRPSIPTGAEQTIRLDTGSSGFDEQLDLNINIIEQVASNFETNTEEQALPDQLDALVADALVKVNAQTPA